MFTEAETGQLKIIPAVHKENKKQEPFYIFWLKYDCKKYFKKYLLHLSHMHIWSTPSEELDAYLYGTLSYCTFYMYIKALICSLDFTVFQFWLHKENNVWFLKNTADSNMNKCFLGESKMNHC